MKQLFSLLTAILLSATSFAGNDITLRDVMYGGYWPETYAAIKPMADGEHFARMSNDRTMIIVTHEMAFAKSVSDKVVFMADGIVEEIGTPCEIFDNPKSPKLKSFLSTITDGSGE